MNQIRGFLLERGITSEKALLTYDATTGSSPRGRRFFFRRLLD